MKGTSAPSLGGGWGFPAADLSVPEDFPTGGVPRALLRWQPRSIALLGQRGSAQEPQQCPEPGAVSHRSPLASGTELAQSPARPREPGLPGGAGSS